MRKVSNSSQPLVCLIFYLSLKAHRLYKERSWSKVRWRADLSHNKPRFQDIIGRFEALLYLREDADDDEGANSAGMELPLNNAASGAPNGQETPYQRTSNMLLGTGTNLKKDTAEDSTTPSRLSVLTR